MASSSPANAASERLEKACLGHIAGDPNKPDEPTGHALTTSAQLMCVSPPHPTCLGVASRPPHPQPQKAPRDLLETLLNLSSTLCAEGELTPTQAWHHIRHQRNFGGIRIRSLRLLAERLLKDEKCHGYVQPPNIRDLVCCTVAKGALGTVQCCKRLVFRQPLLML